MSYVKHAVSACMQLAQESVHTDTGLYRLYGPFSVYLQNIWQGYKKIRPCDVFMPYLVRYEPCVSCRLVTDLVDHYLIRPSLMTT